MKKTTITISVGLRNRIRHSKNVTFAGGYEDFLKRLMDRDKSFSNEQKSYTSIIEAEAMQIFLKKHNYCNHCGIVFERFNGSCCPICINLNDDESNFEEANLKYLTTERNQLNRKISSLKKANLKN